MRKDHIIATPRNNRCSSEVRSCKRRLLLYIHDHIAEFPTTISLEKESAQFVNLCKKSVPVCHNRGANGGLLAEERSDDSQRDLVRIRFAVP